MGEGCPLRTPARIASLPRVQPGDFAPRAAGAVRTDLADELSRREFVVRAGAFASGPVVLCALPVAQRLARPETASGAEPGLIDATLQAFFDTIIPGRNVAVTQSGAGIHPQAILGVDPEPGAVEADALALSHDARIGF